MKRGTPRSMLMATTSTDAPIVITKGRAAASSATTQCRASTWLARSSACAKVAPWRIMAFSANTWIMIMAAAMTTNAPNATMYERKESEVVFWMAPESEIAIKARTDQMTIMTQRFRTRIGQKARAPTVNASFNFGDRPRDRVPSAYTSAPWAMNESAMTANTTRRKNTVSWNTLRPPIIVSPRLICDHTPVARTHIMPHALPGTVGTAKRFNTRPPMSYTLEVSVMPARSATGQYRFSAHAA